MLRLVIGNKNYSSWSMRPWLLMKQMEIPFEEVQVWLDTPDTVADIARYSPSGRVPALIDGEVSIWDSLAICEFLAEKFPHKRLWPADLARRAHARAVAAEMHSGLMDLRACMPMNIRNRYPGCGMNDAVAADIARVGKIWSQCLTNSGGPFLFGEFGIADAMYGPVVFRFQTYGVELAGDAAQYTRTMLAAPSLVELAQLAVAEGRAQKKYDGLYG